MAKLCERWWVVLVNSDLPRGCGYFAACEYIDGKDTRELSAWYALHELNTALGISVPATDYAMDCQTNFIVTLKTSKPARLSTGFEPIKPYSIGTTLNSKSKGEV